MRQLRRREADCLAPPSTCGRDSLSGPTSDGYHCADRPEEYEHRLSHQERDRPGSHQAQQRRQQAAARCSRDGRWRGRRQRRRLPVRHGPWGTHQRSAVHMSRRAGRRGDREVQRAAAHLRRCRVGDEDGADERGCWGVECPVRARPRIQDGCSAGELGEGEPSVGEHLQQCVVWLQRWVVAAHLRRVGATEQVTPAADADAAAGVGAGVPGAHPLDRCGGVHRPLLGMASCANRQLCCAMSLFQPV